MPTKKTKLSGKNREAVVTVKPVATVAEQVHTITGLNDLEFDWLTTALQIGEKSSGANTPVETFIHDLIWAYRWKKFSHPEIVELIAEYQCAAESMHDDVRAYLAQNPHLR